MQKRGDSWYIADKGKRFVLTEKGQKEVASYHHKTVGEPVDEYSDEAVWWAVEEGYVVEVDIPNWIVKPGFEVVYDHKGYTLSAGNPTVFPEMEMAEKYMANYGRGRELSLYIRDAIYEGVALEECKFFEGKRVHNISWYFGVSALATGDLVEQSIVDMLMDLLPPASMRADCSQIGEPANHMSDEDGNWRATYATFKKVDKNIWEYCGECFRGENEPPKTNKEERTA